MRMREHARKLSPWLMLAITVVTTAGVYWPGTAGGWVFDDYPNIIDNAPIHITRGHSTLVAWLNSALSSPSSFLRRPLASLTFSLNWYFGGGDPWPEIRKEPHRKREYTPEHRVWHADNP